MASLRGQLLIAGPALEDPTFHRTVVLVVDHSADGALGLVLNRPADVVVEDVVPQLSPLAGEAADVFVGGPVEPGAVIVLADFLDRDAAALLAFEGVGVMANGQEPDALADRVRAARVFAGHAGWGPGQLDAELERGDWFLEPARWEDAFAEAPESLWAEVLLRKGGSYALIARMPDDPSTN